MSNILEDIINLGCILLVVGGLSLVVVMINSINKWWKEDDDE
jgi:hypothetical protein